MVWGSKHKDPGGWLVCPLNSAIWGQENDLLYTGWAFQRWLWAAGGVSCKLGEELAFGKPARCFSLVEDEWCQFLEIRLLNAC